MNNLRYRFKYRFRPLFQLLFCLSLLVLVAHTSPGRPLVVQAQTPAGTIAYVRPGGEAGDQIRLIEPDGSNDRPLWTAPQPDPGNTHQISVLAWRPNATGLGFASDHEDTCSIFASDIYVIRPDGSDYRRVTTPPACNALASYPQGSVTVTFRNFVSTVGDTFFVYVQGAPGVIQIFVPPGATGTVTFPNVADFGATKQLVFVLREFHRWPAGEVDVLPGQQVASSPNPVTIFGEGILEYGAFSLSWRSDATRIGFPRSAGSCLDVYQVPADNAPLGTVGVPVLNADQETPCSMAWAPTATLANQILYSAVPGFGAEGTGIYRVIEGGKTSNGDKLVSVEVGALLLWYNWLPDGSGFLFVRTTKFANTRYVESNLFEYNFATGQVTQVTQLSDEFVRSFGVSPDSRYIVFERAAMLDSSTSDLWIMNRDGSQLRLLVENGRIPDWSSRAPQLPEELDHHLFLPFISP